ncbi:MAG: hypothetical protein LUF04_07695 [Bacteroides sp.]|nr:hypothetical protein [Bacteroides sp.]
MVFWWFLLLLILLRIGELLISRRHERWLLAHGAIEYGKAHYPFMITLHTLFFVSLIVEYLLTGSSYYNPYLMLFFFGLTTAKIGIVYALGKFWTTKIYRIPCCPLVRKGVYRYFDHPNYVIVAMEIPLIPLIFHLYYTAVIFSLLNIGMLTVRIRKENEALAN